jgi:hypothetical protein
MAFLIAILVLFGILYLLKKLLPCTITACLLILIVFAYSAFVDNSPVSDAGITLCAVALIAAFVADFVRPFLPLFRG